MVNKIDLILLEKISAGILSICCSTKYEAHLHLYGSSLLHLLTQKLLFL